MWKHVIQFTRLSCLHQIHKANLCTSSGIKKFYKNVSIVKTNSDHFEIILDKRKLKSPKGNVFYTTNETLASMVAAEWDSQKEKIEMNKMHLTTLSNTVIDNPGDLDSDSISEKMISFLESDTLCFRMPEPEELLKHQNLHWDPVVQWFANFFQCNIPVTQNVMLPPLDNKTRETLIRYFKSFNIWSLNGLLFATENLKSLILACALINRQLSVEDAIRLSRVEENFQSEKWGKVEFHHDLECNVLQARVAAAAIFTLLNCEKTSISQRL